MGKLSWLLLVAICIAMVWSATHQPQCVEHCTDWVDE